MKKDKFGTATPESIPDDFDERLEAAAFKAGLTGPCLKPPSVYSDVACGFKAGHPGECVPQWFVDRLQEAYELGEKQAKAIKS
jgi:hypothetical protein